MAKDSGLGEWNFNLTNTISKDLSKICIRVLYGVNICIYI